MGLGHLLATALLACVAVVLPLKPALAQSRQAWEARVTKVATIAAATPSCHLLGYSVDKDGITAALTGLAREGARYGLDERSAKTALHTQLNLAEAKANQTMEGFSQNDIKAEHQTRERVFVEWSPLCEGYAVAGNYMTPGAFQASGRPQTYNDYIEFKAETGGLKDMMLAIDMYETGLIPDPGYTKKVTLQRRAAERGSGKAAYHMMESYFLGKGVEKSLQSSLMWALAATGLGYPDEHVLIPDLKAGLTAAEIARAEADATAWLKAHSAAI